MAAILAHARHRVHRVGSTARATTPDAGTLDTVRLFVAVWPPESVLELLLGLTAPT